MAVSEDYENHLAVHRSMRLLAADSAQVEDIGLMRIYLFSADRRVMQANAERDRVANQTFDIRKKS